MRMSQYFLPCGKPGRGADRLAPPDAARRPDPPDRHGIYAWLPLGFRVLKNIERIVREEQDRSGAQEVLMPTIQSADLWRESGATTPTARKCCGSRTGTTARCSGPTNEEVITVLFRNGVKSYRDLPEPLSHPVEVP